MPAPASRQQAPALQCGPKVVLGVRIRMLSNGDANRPLNDDSDGPGAALQSAGAARGETRARALRLPTCK